MNFGRVQTTGLWWTLAEYRPPVCDYKPRRAEKEFRPEGGLTYQAGSLLCWLLLAICEVCKHLRQILCVFLCTTSTGELVSVHARVCACVCLCVPLCVCVCVCACACVKVAIQYRVLCTKTSELDACICKCTSVKTEASAHTCELNGCLLHTAWTGKVTTVYYYIVHPAYTSWARYYTYCSCVVQVYQ